MRRTLVLATLNAFFALASPAVADSLHVVGPDGRAIVREDPFLPAADALPRTPAPVPQARAAAASTRAALRALRDTAQIDQPTYDARLADYEAALDAITRLTGARRTALKGAVAEVDRLAAAGGLTVPRLTLAFETVRRNRQWWTAQPLLAGGRRVRFSGSQLVWQHYPGSGLQVQWLGTFGRANGLWQGRTYDDQLDALLREALTYAVPRAGGIAWESLFTFDGGRPGWVSGLTTGTAAQAYARAAIRLRDSAFFDVGRQALGVFATPAPQGVRVDVAPGKAHYLIYSFWPRLRVLNAFTQALNGLHDFAALANDQPARDLLAQGQAQLADELPTYDTGAWSLYAQGRNEADLGYHKLARDFLRNHCQRVPGGPWCAAADTWTRHLTRKPTVRFRRAEGGRGRAPRAKKQVTVPFLLDKVSTVTTSITLGGTPVAGRTTRRAKGRHTAVFTPAKAGTYRVRVRVVDLAGNASAAQTTVRVGSPTR